MQLPMPPRCLLVILALACPALSARLAAAEKPSAAAEEVFEKQVRPVLAEKCFSCHGARAQRGGLRVDSREALLRGGDSGPALRPGQPDGSLLLQAVRRQGELKMPPKDADRLDEKAVAA